jgi:hypothetical protein
MEEGVVRPCMRAPCNVRGACVHLWHPMRAWQPPFVRLRVLCPELRVHFDETVGDIRVSFSPCDARRQVANPNNNNLAILKRGRWRHLHSSLQLYGKSLSCNTASYVTLIIAGPG